MKFNPKYFLISIIVILAIILSCTGLVLKRISDNPRFDSIPAVSAPFAVLQDPTLLKSEEKRHLPYSEYTPDIDSGLTKPQISTNIPDDEPEKKEFHAVDESYFDDALFIGDSRTVGLYLYAPIGNATYFGVTGMSSYSVFDVTADDTGIYSYLETLLENNSYGKIYFMVGINELGSNKESQREAYLSAVERIHELQPNATIFLMANLGVTYERSVSDSSINRDNMSEFNQWISTNADGITYFYLDANPLFCDDDGYLRSDLSWDGAHVYASVYTEWSQYLMQNGI